ncbi:MAG: pitrilysin family protein [candidate division Zixibacteria bacterium]|nr:pitrilysin family protein [candidate division Zixibacteria bacterium]
MRNTGLKIILLSLICLLLVFSVDCSKTQKLKIIQVKKTEIPVVNFRVMIFSGSADDQKGKEGLAYFASSMLKKGTQSYSREQLEELLDFLSARIDISVDKQVIVVSGTTLKENLDKFYPLFSEVILKPSFPQEEIEKQKKEQEDGVNMLLQDDGELVKECLQDYIYKDHPYGHPVVGGLSSIKSFTRQDVQDFYNTHFVKDNLVIGLAGDIDENLVEKVRKDFSALKEGKVVHPEGTVQPLKGRKLLLVEKEGRGQTQFCFGHPVSFTRKDEKMFFPLYVANTYFGKHRESFGVLFQTVRTEHGLSYGAYSYIEYFRQAGWSNLASPNIPRREQYFSIWTYPKSINGKFTMKLVLKDLTDLVENGVPKEELERYKNFEINHFPFEIQTPQRKLGLLLDEEFYGNYGFVDNFEKNVKGVSSDQVNSDLKKYIFPDDIAIVAIVSNADDFKKELFSDQTVIEYPSGVDGASLKEGDDKVKAFDLKIKPEDVSVVKVSELFK